VCLLLVNVNLLLEFTLVSALVTFINFHLIRCSAVFILRMRNVVLMDFFFYFFYLGVQR
jgi:hypothetical protein